PETTRLSLHDALPISWLWAALGVLPWPAAAQTTAAAANRTVYDAAFFRPYAPSNALQMVERVPAFMLDEGDSAARGFRQAAGNVDRKSTRLNSSHVKS